MSGPAVDVQFAPPVARVFLDRPARHNSLVPEVVEELREAFRRIGEDRALRVSVLAARGKSFSTGGDLAAFREHADGVEAYAERLVGGLHEAMSAIIECPVPVIAAVDGQVCGGALGLVIACDLVVVTERATFRPWYGEVGFSPDGGWTALLPQLIGAGRAAAVQYLDATITAEEAVAWGLALRRVAADDLDKTVAEMCAQVAAKKPGALAATKRLLRDTGWRQKLDAELDAFVATVAGEEARAGVDEHLAALRKR